MAGWWTGWVPGGMAEWWMGWMLGMRGGGIAWGRWVWEWIWLEPRGAR